MTTFFRRCLAFKLKLHNKLWSVFRSTAKDQSEEQIRMSEKLDHLNSCLRKVEAERIAAREALDLVGKQQLNEFES